MSLKSYPRLVQFSLYDFRSCERKQICRTKSYVQAIPLFRMYKMLFISNTQYIKCFVFFLSAQKAVTQQVHVKFSSQCRRKKKRTNFQIIRKLLLGSLSWCVGAAKCISEGLLASKKKRKYVYQPTTLVSHELLHFQDDLSPVPKLDHKISV